MSNNESVMKLTVSYPPYIRSKDSIERIMYTVALALTPSVAASIYFFGINALAVCLTAIVSCVIFEWIMNAIRGQQVTAFDGSAIVTGMLLALNVPSNLSLGMVVLGSFVAIVVAKMLFGGLGYNAFNPALVARVFLLISFPVAMTSWPEVHPLTNWADFIATDAATGASPLGILKTEGVQAISDLTWWKLCFGEITGSMGETSAIAVLLGAALLWIKKYIRLTIPIAFIGTTFIFTGIFYYLDPTLYAHPGFHVLTGGLMIGAFFMATDMVTSPLTTRGQIIFGIGCGLLTAVIRLFGGYPEGVSFAILIMNALVPLLDRCDLAGKNRRHSNVGGNK